jgi:EF-P beta-lysylation protein EpmB
MQHTDLADRGETEAAPLPPSRTWQRELRGSIRRLDDLPSGCLPEEEHRSALRRVEQAFPIVLPDNLLRQVSSAPADDPVLRQYLPRLEELDAPPGFRADAVGDGPARSVPGLLQKYSGRVLLMVSGTCAVHCRYCFRRHYPYGEEPKDLASFEPAFDWIKQDQSIREVILSGGDPLTRTDSWLASLVDRLAEIPHLATLRVHTRVPIVIPARVTPELIGWMTSTRLQPIMVVHVNHPKEIGPETASSLGALHQAGITLLNQSVLLAGVNDSVETLEELSRTLLRLGVLPYYLHQLDRVAGAAHFEVPLARGLALMEELRERVPGYLVPRYVREEPGRGSKTPL